VADLPWPHNLFRCGWAERFAAATDHLDARSELQAATADTARALSPDEVAACPVHQTDWKRAASIAVAVVEAGGDLDDLDRSVEGLEFDLVDAAASFFYHPIFLDGDGLGNGQHRVCAMKLGGAQRCPIED
jgi:hypothetical protein